MHESWWLLSSLIIARLAIIKWLFTGDPSEALREWEHAHALPEEEDLTRCWMADALCDAGGCEAFSYWRMRPYAPSV